jgi:hypothetical protein
VARAVWPSIVCVVASLASAHQASAEELVGLEVESSAAADACGDGEVLRAKIAERLGRDPFTGAPAEGPRLRVVFARDRRTWSADVTLFDAAGGRAGARALTHQGASCEALVTTVVFTIAVLLEDLEPRPEPSSPEEPRAGPNAEPAEKPPPPSPGRPPREASARFDAALGIAGALGGAPVPIAGGEALLGLDLDRFRVEISGRAYLPASSEAEVGVRTRLVHARLSPCYGLVVVAGCFVGTVGSVSGEATGLGVASSRLAGQLHAAGGVGVLSRLFFVDDVLFVRASVDLLFSISRAGFDVGDRRVWTVPPAWVAGTLGLGARLP